MKDTVDWYDFWYWSLDGVPAVVGEGGGWGEGGRRGRGGGEGGREGGGGGRGEEEGRGEERRRRRGGGDKGTFEANGKSIMMLYLLNQTSLGSGDKTERILII